MQGAGWRGHVVGIAAESAQQGGVLDAGLAAPDMAGRGFGGALVHVHGQALVLVREVIATDSRQSPGASPCPRLFVQAIESEHLPLSLIGLWLDRLWEPSSRSAVPCGDKGCRTGKKPEA